jgi:oligopeptide/dipeptide ABC transporter ATP-binding protein
MSGGMRQRVMIAEALACDPRVLLADEPTTALDVTIQAQILDLIKKLEEKRGTTVLLITHDLGVVAETCSYILVMYAGRIVERADAREFFANPRHPYSRGLLMSVPRLDETASALTPVEGQPPTLISTSKGCPFEARCEKRFGKCAEEDPPDIEAGGAKVRCWLYEKRDEELK